MASSPAKTHRPLWVNLATWLGILLVLLCIAAAAFTLPAVQTWAARKLAERTYKKTGFRIQFSYLFLDVFEQRLVIENLTTDDLQQRRMIDVPRLNARVTYDSLFQRNVIFDSVYMPHGILRVITDEQLAQTNITKFVDTLKTWLNGPPAERQAEGPSKDPAIFRIRKAKVKDFRLVISNVSRDTIRNGGIDFNHFYWRDLHATIRDIRIRADTIDADIKQLRTVDSLTGWPVHQLMTHFHMDQNHLGLEGLKLHAGRSYLSPKVTFTYQSPKDLSHIERVDIEASLHNNRLFVEDLARFYPPAKKYPGAVAIHELRTDGRLPDFRVRRFDLGYGQRTRLAGTLAMRGVLDKAADIHLDLKLERATLEPSDLDPFIASKGAREVLHNFGPATAQGTFKGTVEQFEVDAVARSAKSGRVEADMAFRLGGQEKSTYKGSFKVDTLAVGRLSGFKPIGTLTAHGTVDGQGLDLASDPLHLDVYVEQVNLAKIPVRRLGINGTLGKHKVWDLLGSLQLGKGKKAILERYARAKAGQEPGTKARRGILARLRDKISGKKKEAGTKPST